MQDQTDAINAALGKIYLDKWYKIIMVFGYGTFLLAGAGLLPLFDTKSTASIAPGFFIGHRTSFLAFTNNEAAALSLIPACVEVQVLEKPVLFQLKSSLHLLWSNTAGDWRMGSHPSCYNRPVTSRVSPP